MSRRLVSPRSVDVGVVGSVSLLEPQPSKLGTPPGVGPGLTGLRREERWKHVSVVETPVRGLLGVDVPLTVSTTRSGLTTQDNTEIVFQSLQTVGRVVATPVTPTLRIAVDRSFRTRGPRSTPGVRLLETPVTQTVGPT